MTAVTAILMSPATAVETTGIGRSVGRSDFGLRFLGCDGDPGRVRLWCSLTRTLPVGLFSDLAYPRMRFLMKRLNGVVNQTLPMGMVYRYLRSHSLLAVI